MNPILFGDWDSWQRANAISIRCILCPKQGIEMEMYEKMEDKALRMGQYAIWYMFTLACIAVLACIANLPACLSWHMRAADANARVVMHEVLNPRALPADALTKCIGRTIRICISCCSVDHGPCIRTAIPLNPPPPSRTCLSPRKYKWSVGSPAARLHRYQANKFPWRLVFHSPNGYGTVTREFPLASW